MVKKTRLSQCKSFMGSMRVVITMCTSIALTACASIQTVNTPSPESNAMAHEVSVTRKVFIPHGSDEVFKFVVAQDVFPKVLTGFGPLPAVVKTSGNTGAWDVIGTSRLVHLADQRTVSGIVQILWRGYMNVCLENIVLLMAKN